MGILQQLISQIWSKFGRFRPLREEEPCNRKARLGLASWGFVWSGEPPGTRTLNPLIKSQVLWFAAASYPAKPQYSTTLLRVSVTYHRFSILLTRLMQALKISVGYESGGSGLSS